jgi:hypothetical protein
MRHTVLSSIRLAFLLSGKGKEVLSHRYHSITLLAERHSFGNF